MRWGCGCAMCCTMIMCYRHIPSAYQRLRLVTWQLAVQEKRQWRNTSFGYWLLNIRWLYYRVATEEKRVDFVWLTQKIRHKPLAMNQCWFICIFPMFQWQYVPTECWVSSICNRLFLTCSVSYWMMLINTVDWKRDSISCSHHTINSMCMTICYHGGLCAICLLRVCVLMRW